MKVATGMTEWNKIQGKNKQWLKEKESIQVGCLPAVCQPYILRPPDVSTVGVGPQLNKFEQISQRCWYRYQVGIMHIEKNRPIDKDSNGFEQILNDISSER